MSDKKNKDLDFDEVKGVDDLSEFEAVEVVEAVDVTEAVEDIVPAETAINEKPTDANVHDADEVLLDAALDLDIEVEEEIAATDANVGNPDDVEDFDDFDDIDETLAAVGGSAREVRSGSAGKLIGVGVVALLIAGGAAYYFMSSGKETVKPVMQAPVVVSNDLTSSDVQEGGGVVSDLPIEEATMSIAVDEQGLGEPPLEDALDIDSLDSLPQPEIVNETVDVVEIADSIDLSQIPGDAIASADVDENIVLDAALDDAPLDDVMEESLIEIPDDGMLIDESSVPSEPVILDEIMVDPSTLRPAGLNSAALSSPVVNVDIDNSGAGSQEQVDIYFDSIQRIEQQADTLQSSGPVAVDPIAEPASKYLVVSDMKPSYSIEAEVVQAKRALKLGRYDAAYDYYDRLYRKSPKDEAILMGRAIALQKLGRANAAVNAYEELLGLHPNNADALVNMLGLVKGQYPAVALQKLLSIRQDFPRNAGVAAQIGLTYASMDNYVDAKRYINIAMEIEPNNALHAYNMAVVYDREGQSDKAVRYYDQALRTDAIYGGGRSVNRDVIYDRLSKLR